MGRTIAGISVLLTLLAGTMLTGCGGKPETAAPGTADAETHIPPAAPLLVGLSLADLKEERWKRDRDMFRAKVEELGGRLLVMDAGGDAQAQIEQCKNLLLQGVKVLVVVPKNADAAAPIIIEAHLNKVPVLSYDRLITNADTDLYISFNNFRVGEIQAAEVLRRAPKGKYLLLGGDPADKNAGMLREGQLKILQPAIDRGAVQVVADPFCDKWLRSEATRYTEDALAKHPDIVAVVASNDNTGGGAIAALKAKGLAGKVFVSGQDADLEACQNVVRGLQAVTVYKPIRRIAEASAEIAVALARGQSVAAAQALVTDGARLELDNGKTRVPTIFLTPIAVTEANIDDTVIADGYHSRDAVYAP